MEERLVSVVGRGRARRPGAPAAAPDAAAATGPRSPLRRAVVVVVAISLAMWLGAALVLQFLNVLAGFRELRLLDLQVYRMGGQAVLHGQPLYDAVYPHDSLPFTYTPFAGLLFVPLAFLPAGAAALVATAANVVALGRVCRLVSTNLPVPLGSVWPPALRTLFLVCVAVSLWPVRSTIEYGQVNLVVLWLVAEDFLTVRDDKRGGFLTGVAAGIKVTPAFLIVGLLAAGRTRRAVNAGLALGVSVLAGFLVQPASAWSYWTGGLWDTSRVGSPAHVANQSWNGVLWRFAGPGGSPRAWVALVGATTAVVLWTGRRLWSHGFVLPALGVGALGMLLVSPMSWSHHWVWLLVIVAVLLVPLGASQGRWIRAGRLVLLVATTILGSLRVMFFVPEGGGAEYRLTGGQQIMASAYVWLAALVIAHLAIASRALSRQPAIDPTEAARLCGPVGCGG